LQLLAIRDGVLESTILLVACGAPSVSAVKPGRGPLAKSPAVGLYCRAKRLYADKCRGPGVPRRAGPPQPPGPLWLAMHTNTTTATPRPPLRCPPYEDPRPATWSRASSITSDQGGRGSRGERRETRAPINLSSKQLDLVLKIPIYVAGARSCAGAGWAAHAPRAPLQLAAGVNCRKKTN